MELLEQEQSIGKVLHEYLPLIKTENSILKGNLLPVEKKEFILRNSNAFIIGLISDQSVKAELAWSLPYRLFKRIGSFDFKYITENYTIDSLEQIIKAKPSLHRYPNRMATFIYEAMLKILKEYKSDASGIWNNESADVIINRFEEFKGISHKKANLGALLLIRDLGKNITNKKEIDIAYDVHIRRIFLRTGLVEKDTENNVLQSARRINKEFPGELTTSFWTIGRKYCHVAMPICESCPLNKYCKKVGVEEEALV